MTVILAGVYQYEDGQVYWIKYDHEGRMKKAVKVTADIPTAPYKLNVIVTNKDVVWLKVSTIVF